MNFSSSASFWSNYSTNFAGNGVTSSHEFAQAQGAAAPEGQSLEVVDQLNTTGMIVNNAMGNRTPYVQGVQYWGYAWNWHVGAPLKPDWITSPPSLPSTGCTQVSADPGYKAYAMMTISGTLTNTAGYSVSLGVGVSYPEDGVSIGPSIAFTFQVTSSGATSTSAQAIVTVLNTGSTEHYYEYCFEGDSSTTSGIVLHIWQTS